MIIGSVVRLSRPYYANEDYKDAVGIVEEIHNSKTDHDEFVCRVRFVDICYPAMHKTIEIFQHRLDELKE